MNLYNTNMHLSVFVFIVAELLILFYLCIHYLYQPRDKNRLYLIVLLLLVLAYNVIGGVFPDARIPLSIADQNKIEYASGFLMCCFVPYYFFKVYKLDSMRWHISYGVLFCFVLPYVLCFLVLYPLLPDWQIIRKIGVIIPFIYSILFVCQLGAAIYKKHKARSLSGQREIIWIFFAVAPWVSLSLTSYFAAPDYVEYPLTNTGFLVVLFLFIRNHIHTQRAQDNYLTQANGLLAALNQQLQRSNTELEEKVAERTLQLQELNEKRMNTFANLAHEMKTPLTLVRNYMHQLASEYPRSQSVHFAKKHIFKLSRDIVNLFDLLGSEKGIHHYNHQTDTNLSTLIGERIRLFEASAQRRNIHMEHSLEANLFVRADQTALERVVNNLLDNAIKYSPGDSTVFVSLRTESDSELAFCVRDQGAGIEPRFQQLIFEPYERISHTHSQGMGMGLPIVRTILDQIGGSIRLVSSPAQAPGSEFIIRLPYRQQASVYDDLFMRGHEPILVPQEPALSGLMADEYAPAGYTSFTDKEFTTDGITCDGSMANGSMADQPAHDPDKKTLLLVEDNPEMLHYLIASLSGEYNVYYSLDGAAALEKLTTMPEPDLIISDIAMPQMDGVEMARRLGEDELNAHIPIIFLSAARCDDSLLDAGAVDFVAKPFSIGQLTAKIASLLRLQEKQQAYFTQLLLEQARRSPVGRLRETQLLPPSEQLPLKVDELFTNGQVSHRQKEVILLLAQGLANKNIAHQLGIEETTVAKHIQNIFRKFNVNSKLELVNKILR